MRAILLAFTLVTTAIAFVPTADAMNGCTVLDPGGCPGVVCYGQGSMYGYKICVGPGFPPPCDPGPCPPPK